jgi:DNA-directed RNA polymerase subunit RPC12/RpoP
MQQLHDVAPWIACPQCASTNIVRAHHKTFLDYLLLVVGMHAYRCRSCKRRFRQVSWDVSEGDE